MHQSKHSIKSRLLASLFVIVCFAAPIGVKLAAAQKSKVFDCSAGINDCRYTSLDYIYKCSDGNSCIQTTEGLDEAAYISYPRNYVSGHFSKTNYTVSLISRDIRLGWDMDFLPTGEIIVTNKKGRVFLVKDETTSVIADIDVISEVEAGLLGVAIDPDYKNNQYIYFFYTYRMDPDDLDKNVSRRNYLKTNSRISRFLLRGGQLSDEVILVDEIPGSLEHGGGRLAFGPDGKLYATTGDANKLNWSQDPSIYAGKILRLNKDGSIPNDNPIPGSLMYSLGHRNPQGLAWNPETNILYASEIGPYRFDEVNRIDPNGNYGWGAYKCDEVQNKALAKVVDFSLVRRPVVCFKNWTMAPSGMDFVRDADHPWYGDLFLAGLKGGHVRRYNFQDGKIIGEEIFFISKMKLSGSVKNKMDLRIRNVRYHNKALYVLGDHFGLVKIEPISK